MVHYEQSVQSLLTFEQGTISPRTIEKWIRSPKLRKIVKYRTREHICAYFFELLCFFKISMYLNLFKFIFFWLAIDLGNI